MHECNKHFIPKYGEIKPAIDMKPGEMGGGGGGRAASNQQPCSDTASSSFLSV